MPVHDTRESTKLASYGGGNLEVLLSSADVDAINGGTGGAAGWYALGYLQGGRYGGDVEEGDACITEDGSVLAPAPSTETPYWENFILDWSDRTYNFVEFLKDNARRMRYKMPYDNDALDPQTLLIYKGQVANQNWEVALGDKTKRGRQIRIEAVQDGANPLYLLKELPLDSGAASGDWANAPYSDFNDDAASPF